MNILVVDDHEDVREVISELLTMEGHRVSTAYDGKNAIDLLGVYKFDLIISDIVMPEIEGVELILRLRESGIPIISISGLPRESVMSEFFSSLGIIGLLQKPIDNESLLNLVKSANIAEIFDNNKNNNDDEKDI